MKKILIKFMIVVSPILLIAYPLDMLLSRLLKNVDAEYVGEIQIWNKIYEGKFNYDLYIYGSSRAINHIDPQYITKKTGLSAYNIGMDGQHFMMEEFRHRQLLKYNKKPQYIILGLDDTSLIKTDGLYLKEQLLPYMLWNSDIEEILSEFEGYGKYDCQIPLIRYVGDYKTLGYITSTFLKKQENKKSFRENGYNGIDQEWTGTFDKLLLEKDIPKKYLQTNADTKELFIKFINECKEKDINLIFVYTPEYYKIDLVMENRTDILDFYTTTAQKYDIPFLDYSKDSICYKQSFFYNATHMNLKGSQIFSKQLAEDLCKQNILLPLMRKK